MNQTAEYDPKDFENPAESKGVYAKFYYRAMPNEVKSAEEGRPVFDDVEFVEIMAAGNGTNIIRRPVRPQDKQRFREAYTRFREGDENQLVGTPLTEITWISVSMREELHYMKVRTLEQLADLSDTACGKMPGMYDLKKKAGEWLKKSTDAAPFTALHKENEDLKTANDALAARLDALEKSMGDKTAAKKSKGADQEAA